MTHKLLGKVVTDSISGVTGTVTCATVYMNGCVRLCIEPKPAADGKINELYVDEQRVTKAGSAEIGGPMMQRER